MELHPKKVKIIAKGQQKRIEQMRKVDIFAYVDCTELMESTSYDLPVNVNLPSGLQLIKIDPAIIHIEIKK